MDNAGAWCPCPISALERDRLDRAVLLRSLAALKELTAFGIDHPAFFIYDLKNAGAYLHAVAAANA